MCSSCNNWKTEPVVIGHKNPVHYQSICGYPKDRLPVYRQSETEGSHLPCGSRQVRDAATPICAKDVTSQSARD
jgi:hypothetical protein